MTPKERAIDATWDICGNDWTTVDSERLESRVERAIIAAVEEKDARIAELEAELIEAGDYLNRNDRLEERMAELEMQLAVIREALSVEGAQAAWSEPLSTLELAKRLRDGYLAQLTRSRAAVEEEREDCRKLAVMHARPFDPFSDPRAAVAIQISEAIAARTTASSDSPTD